MLLCMALAPAAAYAFSISQQEQYSASASLLFRDPQFDQKVFGSAALPPSSDPAREAATNVRLVSLEAVAARTARRLNRNSEDVEEAVTAASEGQSDVVSVTATDPNPRAAAVLANAFAREYIAFRRAADRSKIREAQALIRRQLEGIPEDAQEGNEARTLLQQLDVLGSLQTGNAELVQPAATPRSPASPKTEQNTIIAGILGTLLGIALALLFERLDRRIRQPKELEAIFERPVLGTVADSRALAKSGGDIRGLGASEREAFRMLRANLRYFNVDHEVSSVLVTSAAPGDGKTTVSWNLAASAAEGGGRVLLIEADMRHPGIADGLGLRETPGLSTVLAGYGNLEDVVQEIPVQERQNGRELRTVNALLAGPLPPNPSDLLESDRMRELIAVAEQRYDLVVIDTPPTSVVSDAIPLVKEVRGVIVVGRLGKTTRDAATHLMNQLRNLDAPVLGVVVNALKADGESYGYGYSYAYGAYGERAPDVAGGIRS